MVCVAYNKIKIYFDKRVAYIFLPLSHEYYNKANKIHCSQKRFILNNFV